MKRVVDHLSRGKRGSALNLKRNYSISIFAAQARPEEMVRSLKTREGVRTGYVRWQTTLLRAPVVLRLRRPRLLWPVRAGMYAVGKKARQLLWLRVTSPDFSLELTGFFPGKHLIHFMVLKMKDFRNFVLDNCIFDFDAEQVYLEPQVTNLKNKKVTANPKPQTLKKNWFFENRIP